MVAVRVFNTKSILKETSCVGNSVLYRISPDSDTTGNVTMQKILFHRLLIRTLSALKEEILFSLKFGGGGCFR